MSKQKKRRPMRASSGMKSKTRTAYLFMAPSLAGVFVFVLLPFADTIRRSFTSALGNSFVGFANYASAINNSAFQLAAKNTARFIATCLPVLVFGSLLLAIMVRAVPPGAGARYKTVFLVTMAIPVASIGILWKTVFADAGLANGILTHWGFQPISFLFSDAAFWVVVASYVWKNCGYDMVLWLSGFDSISQGLYEAARIDGANERQVFRYVTMPGLMPSLFLITVLSLINTFKVFREITLITGTDTNARPHESIYLLQHLFNGWFINLDVGRMCAGAVMLAVVLLLIILLLKKMWGVSEG